MSVAISWAKKVQLAKCDIMVGFPKFSHIYVVNRIVITAIIYHALHAYENNYNI